MLTIGLTGPTGSGKGIVGAIFREQGIPVLDTDAVYHDLVSRPSACMEELKARFGETIVTAEGALDRKKLSALVLGDSAEAKEKRTDLNRIAHRYVLDTCRNWLKQMASEGKRAAVIDAPLLIESGFHKECGAVVAVLAQKQIRLARIMLRDGLTEAEARKRMLSQPHDDFYTEQADFTVRNDGDLSQAKNVVMQIIDALPAWQVQKEV